MVPIHKIQLPDSNEHWLEFNAKYEIFGTGTEGGPCPPVWSGSGKVASVHSRDLFHALICTTGTLKAQRSRAEDALASVQAV